MSEVVVVVTLQVKPGHEEEMRATLTGACAGTHAEDGCLVYAIHQATGDPSRFAIIECWASQEHLDTHLAAPHVKEMIVTIDGMAAGQPDFGVYAPLAAGDPQKGTVAGRA
jgi:quinol monooxygenase YgiN